MLSVAELISRETPGVVVDAVPIAMPLAVGVSNSWLCATRKHRSKRTDISIISLICFSRRFIM
jgi:hypothetical protein